MALDQIKHAVSVASLSALVATFAIQDADGAELERARRGYNYYYKTNTYDDDDFTYTYVNTSRISKIVGGVIAGICVLGLCSAGIFFFCLAAGSNASRAAAIAPQPQRVAVAAVAGVAVGATVAVAVAPTPVAVAAVVAEAPPSYVPAEQVKY
jgi:hypothetical protein